MGLGAEKTIALSSLSTLHSSLFSERMIVVAKFEKRLTGNFDEFLQKISDSVLNGSMSASYEDGSDWSSDDVRCAVRVFERYSAAGKNRVSMNVTLVGKGDELFLTAITSGGSSAVFWKINTMGEEAFDCVKYFV